jgi:hypothetical protein
MNCLEVRPLLPALAYDDLPPAEAALVRRHLDACPGCRDEYAGLTHARAALDAIPVPAVKVDFARLYTEVAARQERQARHWRRISLAATALAAAVLVAIGLRLQVRVGANELVIAWGEQPSRERDRADVRPPVAHDSGAHVEERLKLLDDLTHALAADNDRRDRRYQQEMADLGRRLQSLQRVAMEKWLETERNLSALYVAQFKPSNERNTP